MRIENNEDSKLIAVFMIDFVLKKYTEDTWDSDEFYNWLDTYLAHLVLDGSITKSKAKDIAIEITNYIKLSTKR